MLRREQPVFAVADQGVVVVAGRGLAVDQAAVSAAVQGLGGSIPMTSPLQAANPDAGILILGAGDDSSNIHGIDESLPLDDWEANTLAIALLLADADALRTASA